MNAPSDLNNAIQDMLLNIVYPDPNTHRDAVQWLRNAAHSTTTGRPIKRTHRNTRYLDSALAHGILRPTGAAAGTYVFRYDDLQAHLTQHSTAPALSRFGRHRTTGDRRRFSLRR